MRWADVVFRPIEQWPGELTAWRRRSQFSAPWGKTLQLVERELEFLGAHQVVVQVALTDRDFRIDGTPRARAQSAHPGIILAFESEYGPLQYATDTFDSWQDNLRAVALSLESLRAVNRYGVSRHGEQYRGWRALPAGSDDTHGIPDTKTARDYLNDVYGGDMRRALMETHSDRGGDREEFGKVMRIKGLLGASA
jgi:hypothetical protein